MASAGSITWDLTANSSKFVAALEKANKAGKSWGDNLVKTGKSAATNIAKSAATAAAAAAKAAAAAAASLAALYTVTAGNIDEQSKFADKIGVTTKALGGLQHAGDLTGVSTENMNLGLQRMTRRVAEAAQGTGTAVDALDALNLSAEELNQLTPDEQFLAIADAMGEVEGRSEQVRLAFKLFDSGGVALLNTMDMASDGIREAMEQAEHLGIALNRVDAAQVENANDAFDNMTKVSAGISRQITVAFAPAVEGISNKLLDMALDMESFGEIGDTVFNAVIKGAGYVANYFYFVSLELSGLKAGFLELAAIAAESMTDSAETVSKVLNATVGNLGKLIEWITDQLSSLIAMGKDLPGHAGKWARNVSGILEELGKKVNEKLQFDEEGVVEGIEAIRVAADEAFKDFEEKANQELPSDFIDNIVAGWQQASRESAEAAANAKVYNDILSELEDKGPVGIELTAESQLDALQRSLGYQEQVIDRAYQNQIEQIKNLVLEEEQIRAAGFDSLEAMQEEFTRKTQDQWIKELEELQENVNTSTNSMEQGFNRWGGSFTNTMSDMVTEGKMNFSGFAESVINDLIRMSIQANITNQIMRSMGWGSGASPQGMAAGGPVERGTTYMVGERGPELFTSSHSGNIIPNNRLASGGNTTVNVYTQPGENTEVSTRSSPDGDIIELFMKQVDSRINEQVSRGQGLARTLEGRYGLTRRST